ncbi:hypothetical protein [Streptomyces termitum]|uniref:hypothetical protein n=1 Tax=Streptomyces termitum TaxID=67368 RepID=UPI0037ABF441
MTAPALAPRLLRAAVFTAVCVVLSALGHALAAGTGVPPWSLLAGFLGVFGTTLLLTGRQHSLGFVVTALAGGQLGLHLLFGLGGHRSAPGTGADDALIRMAARITCGDIPGSFTPADATGIVTRAGLDPETARATAGVHLAGGAHLMPPSLPMTLGHLLAALVAGWLLRRGDLALVRLAELSEQGAAGLAGTPPVRALRAALRLARALLAGIPAPAPAGPRGPLRTAFDSSPPPVAEALQHTVIRRGPPAAACVLAA